MSDLVSVPIYPAPASLPSMSEEEIARVTVFETELAKLPQINFFTNHVIHAGMYARTMMMPKNTTIVGVLIKRATLVIVSGHAIAYIGDRAVELKGFNVIPASALRKQAFLALEETHITMLFPTSAKTVEDAEKEFTDEHDRLGSHNDPSMNRTTITED